MGGEGRGRGKAQGRGVVGGVVFPLRAPPKTTPPPKQRLSLLCSPLCPQHLAHRDSLC